VPEFSDPSTVEDLPPVHVSLVLIRTGAQAVIKAMGRKRGERFLREWMELLATEESVAMLLPIRAPKDRAAQERTRREAVAWLRQIAPTLIGSLPKK
jgi:hypothetical protein